jgi:hypothetical protein
MLQITQHSSHISQLRYFVRRTICRPDRTPSRRPSTGEKLMRTFASAFLSAIAALTISGTLFSVVLI